MFFGIKHIKDNSYRMSVWGMDGKAAESEAVVSIHENGDLYIKSLAEAYEDATGSTPEEAAEEFSAGMDQWLENLLKGYGGWDECIE